MDMRKRDYILTVLVFAITMFMYLSGLPMNLLTGYFTDALLIIVYYSVNVLMGSLIILYFINKDNVRIDLKFKLSNFGTGIKNTCIGALFAFVLYAVCLGLRYAPFEACDDFGFVLIACLINHSMVAMIQTLLALGIMYNLMMNAFKKNNKKYLISGIISALLISAFYVKLYIGTEWYEILVVFLMTFALGLMLVNVYKKSENIIVCMLYLFSFRTVTDIIASITKYQFGYNMRYLVSVSILSVAVMIIEIIKLAKAKDEKAKKAEK